MIKASSFHSCSLVFGSCSLAELHHVTDEEADGELLRWFGLVCSALLCFALVCFGLICFALLLGCLAAQVLFMSH